MKFNKNDKKFIKEFLKVDVPLGTLMLIGYYCVSTPFVIGDTPHTLPYQVTLIFAIILGVAVLYIANKRGKEIEKEIKKLGH